MSSYSESVKNGNDGVAVRRRLRNICYTTVSTPGKQSMSRNMHKKANKSFIPIGQTYAHRFAPANSSARYNDIEI